MNSCLKSKKWIKGFLKMFFEYVAFGNLPADKTKSINLSERSLRNITVSCRQIIYQTNV